MISAWTEARIEDFVGTGHAFGNATGEVRMGAIGGRIDGAPNGERYEVHDTTFDTYSFARREQRDHLQQGN